MNPVTPDGRYFVVKGRLWRCSNLGPDDQLRQRLVNVLMYARRAVKNAKASGKSRLLAEALRRLSAEPRDDTEHFEGQLAEAVIGADN